MACGMPNGAGTGLNLGDHMHYEFKLVSPPQPILPSPHGVRPTAPPAAAATRRPVGLW
jgi:hypothetical protein